MAKESVHTIDDFKQLMFRVRDLRRKLVQTLLLATEQCQKAQSNGGTVAAEVTTAVNETLAVTLQQLRQFAFSLRRSSSQSEDADEPDRSYRTFSLGSASDGTKVVLNIQDEMSGIHKDIEFCVMVQEHGVPGYIQHFAPLVQRLLPAASSSNFDAERLAVTRLVERMRQDGRPNFITDWDGTMKTYSSQYVTCMQPAADAVLMCLFARNMCGLAAVLTAGPLRDPGILDLTAVPEQDWLLFGGSWGREWLLPSGRVVDDHNISDEGKNTLSNFASSVQYLLDRSLLTRDDDPARDQENDAESYSQFAMVGSGFQRKVDRVTLGVQSVCGQVSQTKREDYVNTVKKLMNNADPAGKFITLHEDDREIEICVKHTESEANLNDDQPQQHAIWNKAHGVEFLFATLHQSIGDAPVLICGDTHSDVPMVQSAKTVNALNTYSIFVDAKDEVKKSLDDLLPDDHRAFVSAPGVIHAAMADLLWQYVFNKSDAAL